MEELNLNSSESVEEVVIPQETEQVETTESANEEVTTSQENIKPVQTPEQNSLYAQIRREAEQKALDKFVSETYGESHGIHTKSEYDRAVKEQQEETQRQEYREKGIDPDMVNKLINDNPTVKQANEIIAKQQQSEKINSEVQALFKEFPEAREMKIPDSVFLESIDSKIPLVYAYAKYATKNALAIAEQKALKGITQNAQTSPGALSTGQAAQTSSINSMSKADFQRMQNEVLMGERKTL